MYQNKCVNVKTVLGEWEKALLLSVDSPYICHISGQESDPKQHSRDICSCELFWKSFAGHILSLLPPFNLPSSDSNMSI